jgi:hypothetical protein
MVPDPRHPRGALRRIYRPPGTVRGGTIPDRDDVPDDHLPRRPLLPM